MVFGGQKTKILDMNDNNKICGDLESVPDFSEPYLAGTEMTSGTLFNGKPVICGGSNLNGGVSSVCSIYEKSGWRKFSTMSEPRQYHTSIQLNENQLWIIGGQGRQSSDIIYTNGTAISGPKMPYENFMWNCITKLHNGTILFVGGFENRKTTILYELSSESFRYGPDMIFARQGPGCTLFYSPLHNGRPVIIVTGGMFGNRVSGNGEDKTEIWDYTKTNKWLQSKLIFISKFIILFSVNAKI